MKHFSPPVFDCVGYFQQNTEIYITSQISLLEKDIECTISVANYIF